MGRFDDQHVIITGATGGIGGAAARAFADEGASVSVLGRNREAADAVVSEIQKNGGRACAVLCDISRRDQVDQAVRAATEALGPVRVLVNNAGHDVFAPFLATTADDWRALIDTNLIGTMNMCQAVLPDMVEQSYGRIVTVASDAARVGSTEESVYAACKAGLVALSKTLAREHARDGITVNAVCPGPTDTPLFQTFIQGTRDPEKFAQAFLRSIPMRRIGTPEDIASSLLYFADRASGYVTGQVLSVSGGLTMAG